jgi:hypothetical protein
VTYRGIEYAIRLGVGRGEWVVAISFPDNADGLLQITGTREQAGTAARRYIREWMQRQRRKARLANPSSESAPNPPRSAG